MKRALVVIALVAACSDSSITVPQWLAQADAVCRDSQALVEELGQPESVADITRIAGERVTIREAELDRLEQLAVPAEIEAEVDAMLEAFSLANGELAEIPSSGDLGAIVRAVRDARAEVVAARRQAANLGLLDCGLDPSDLNDTVTFLEAEQVRERLISAFGADGELAPDEITCIVDRVLAQIGPERIAGQAVDGAPLDDETIGAIDAAVGECLSPDRLAEIEG